MSTDNAFERTATPAPEWLTTSWIMGKKRRQVRFLFSGEDWKNGWFIGFTDCDQSMLLETEDGHILVRGLINVRFIIPGEAFGNGV